MSSSRPTPTFIAITLLSTVLVGCGGGQNPDKRALPGAEADVSLGAASREFHLVIPRDAKAIRFGVFSGQETNLELKFETACSSVDSFLRKSRLGGGRKNVRIPTLVETVAHRNKWPLKGRSVRLVESGHAFDGLYRAVAVSDRGDGECQVVVAGFH